MRWRPLGLRVAGTLLALVLGAGCAAAKPDPNAGEWRARLAGAIKEPVTTRNQRDEHSRLLVDAIAHDALDGLNLDQVQAALGRGEPCSGQALCAEQGFAGDDLYYAIGEPSDDKIKQLPVLIVGFDTHGTVKRVYTLKTH